jgi:transposase
MNNIKEKRLSQSNEKSFIVDVDISKIFHVARIPNYKGIEMEPTEIYWINLARYLKNK